MMKIIAGLSLLVVAGIVVTIIIDGLHSTYLSLQDLWRKVFKRGKN